MELDTLVSNTARRLSIIFKKEIIVNPIPPEFTPENLAYWSTLNYKPVFLPHEEIEESQIFDNWKKPPKWFYDEVRAGNIKSSQHDLWPTLLRGCWHLADFNVSADFTDGSQVFVNDSLGPTIARLREENLVGNHHYVPINSRFAITPNEWLECVLAYVASMLRVTRSQISLERAIEFNAIGNLYDSNRGRFNALEWLEDIHKGSYHLFSGGKKLGGLSYINHCWGDNRSAYIAARPFVSFNQ